MINEWYILVRSIKTLSGCTTENQSSLVPARVDEILLADIIWLLVYNILRGTGNSRNSFFSPLLFSWYLLFYCRSVLSLVTRVRGVMGSPVDSNAYAIYS